MLLPEHGQTQSAEGVSCMKRLFATAVASLALIASPIAHAAAADRVSPPVEAGASELAGGLPLPALVVLLAIIAGGIFIVADEDDSPDSP
jgi:hypothetical protein